MPRPKYYVSYATQTDIDGVLFHNEDIDMDPVQWIRNKNILGGVRYSLIMWEMIPSNLKKCNFKSMISYVTQQGSKDMSFKSEMLVNKHPIAWIDQKNDEAQGKVKYVLINWWRR